MAFSWLSLCLNLALVLVVSGTWRKSEPQAGSTTSLTTADGNTSNATSEEEPGPPPEETTPYSGKTGIIVAGVLGLLIFCYVCYPTHGTPPPRRSSSSRAPGKKSDGGEPMVRGAGSAAGPTKGGERRAGDQQNAAAPTAKEGATASSENKVIPLNPSLYRKANLLQRKDSSSVLSTYGSDYFGHLQHPVTVLDIGCGPGDITVDFVLPILPKGSHLWGADSNPEMINTAKAEFGENPNLHFRPYSVQNVDQILQDVPDKFDFVVSFFMLHWLRDVPAAMSTVKKVVKPEGKLLIVCNGWNPIYDVWENMAQHPKWKTSMENVQEVIGPYHKSKDAKADITADFEKAGLTVTRCDALDQNVVFPNMDFLRSALQAVNPFIKNMSPAVIDDYLSDMVKSSLPYLKVQKDNKYSVDYQILVVHAVAP